MNTEFPNRIPTIRQSNSTASQTTVTVKTGVDDSEYKNKVTNVLKEALKLLNNVADNVGNLLNRSKTNTRTSSKTKDSDGIIPELSTQTEILKTGVNSLNKLTDAIEGYFKNNNTINAQNNNNSKDDDKKDSENTSLLKLSFRKIINGISAIRGSWNSGIKNLQRTTENLSDSIGSTIGSVFGSGLFGKMISGIITKSLSFAVSKILVGMVLSNLPMLAIGAAVIAAIYLVVKYSKEIWEGIKWLGYSIDQAFDALISILPWGKSKYEESRKQLAGEAGVSEDFIKEYYGDTVRGRNQAYEDWKKAGEDEAFKQDLISKITAAHQEAFDKLPTYDSFQFSDRKRTDSIITQIYNNTTVNNGSGVSSMTDLDLQLPNVPTTIVSPVTTNSSQMINFNDLGKNINSAKAKDSMEFGLNRSYGSFGLH